MKKLTAVLAILILLIATPVAVNAGSIQLESYNGDSWVVGTASGNGTFEINADLDNYPDSFAPTNPARSTHAWKYVDGSVVYDTTGTVIQPEPEEAIAEVESLLIDAYEDTGAEYPEIEAMALLDRYPSVERQLEQERYQLNIDYIRQKIEPKESIVSDTMVNDYENYLKVN